MWKAIAKIIRDEINAAFKAFKNFTAPFALNRISSTYGNCFGERKQSSHADFSISDENVFAANTSYLLSRKSEYVVILHI